MRIGDLIKFSVFDGGEKRQQEGTAMSEEINGLILVSVHDTFVTIGGAFLIDKNILPVFAVRVDAIESFDPNNKPQGAKR